MSSTERNGRNKKYFTDRAFIESNSIWYWGSTNTRYRYWNILWLSVMPARLNKLGCLLILLCTEHCSWVLEAKAIKCFRRSQNSSRRYFYSRHVSRSKNVIIKSPSLPHSANLMFHKFNQESRISLYFALANRHSSRRIRLSFMTTMP